MTWDEYVNTDPRRVAQAAVNAAAEERRRVAKDDNATDAEFDAATARLRESQAHLKAVEQGMIKDMFKDMFK